MKILEFVKKYWKALLFSLTALGLLLVAVLGWHWEETAETPFWWTFWPIAAVVAAIGFILLVRWFGTSQKKW